MDIESGADLALSQQPHAIVERDGVRYTILGTAHVSHASTAAVRALVASGRFDAVAIELDPQRHRALTEPGSLHQLDLVRIIREGKTSMVAANLALSSYQRRLAEQLGIEPGAELKAAALDAAALGLPVHLIDRDVGITLRRSLAALGFWSRVKISAGILAGLFAGEDVDAGEIEKLKQGDILESSFGEFASGEPRLYTALIAERDRYMAARLRQNGSVEQPDTPLPTNVLVVIGAGHLKGLSAQLRDDHALPATVRAELEAVPQGSGIPWFTIALVVLVLGGFAWGFHQGGLDLGTDLIVYWVLLTGSFGALGCLLAGGHPLSILGAFIASPVTPLHPALASGTVSAIIEAWVRKPRYADFLALRDDVGTLRGWWKNRVARVLLNFFLTSVGTAIGVWVAGLKMARALL